MNFKKITIFFALLLCLTVFVPAGICSQIQLPVRDLKAFRELLTSINASFVSPDGFTEAKPINSEKFPYQYGLQLPDSDFEIRFQVNQLKTEWKNFDLAKGDKVNPDSLYSKLIVNEVKNLAGGGKYFARNIPPKILQQYNADLGRSYFLSLADSPETNHYQYALLVVIQKNHCGNITVVCLGNERGPAFFKNINKLKDCLRFTN